MESGLSSEMQSYHGKAEKSFSSKTTSQVTLSPIDFKASASRISSLILQYMYSQMIGA